MTTIWHSPNKTWRKASSHWMKNEVASLATGVSNTIYKIVPASLGRRLASPAWADATAVSASNGPKRPRMVGFQLVQCISASPCHSFHAYAPTSANFHAFMAAGFPEIRIRPVTSTKDGIYHPPKPMRPGHSALPHKTFSPCGGVARTRRISAPLPSTLRDNHRNHRYPLRRGPQP